MSLGILANCNFGEGMKVLAFNWNLMKMVSFATLLNHFILSDKMI